MFALTETWQQASDDLSLKRCAPPGYSIVDAARCQTETRGGGVALIHSNWFTARRLKFDVKPSTFDVLGCTLRSASLNVVYVVIYRPGSEAVSERLFDELTELLEVVATFHSQVIVTGDFNVHVNDRTDRHSIRLAELLATFNMQQAVRKPTHRSGNTLDLVITRSDGCPSNCTVDPPDVFSDHSLVVCDFPSIPFAVRRVTQTCRPWKKMDRAGRVQHRAVVVATVRMQRG